MLALYEYIIDSIITCIIGTCNTNNAREPTADPQRHLARHPDVITRARARAPKTRAMYGSYSSLGSSSSSYNSVTSHSAFGSMSLPLDIAPRASSRRGPDPLCAYPSWPRRSSLGEDDASEQRASSYITDEELFMDVFEDDACSVSSQGSASPVHTPVGAHPPAPALTEAEFLQMQREQLAYEREMRRILLAEKELRRRQAEQDHRRRQAATKRRSSSSPSKKGKSKLSAMTTIAEAD